MDMFMEIILFLIGCCLWIEAVPPEACFANFRWDDCGQAPVPVMYYWKSGSRCEVGLWRGCLPNLNMFQDEYECVSTCIFTARAGDEDYHKMYLNDETEPSYQDTTDSSTDGNCTVTATGDTMASDSVTGNGTGATEAPAGDTKATDSNSTGVTNVVTEGITNTT